MEQLCAVLEINPDEPLAHLRLAQVAALHQEWLECLRLLESAETAPSGRKHACAFRLRAYTALGTGGAAAQCIHYVVEAKYANNVLAPLPDKATVEEEKARALEAEKRLLKLSWKVTPAEYDEKTGWKETTGDLLDVDGSKLKINADGGFEPPTITA